MQADTCADADAHSCSDIDAHSCSDIDSYALADRHAHACADVHVRACSACAISCALWAHGYMHARRRMHVRTHTHTIMGSRA